MSQDYRCKVSARVSAAEAYQKVARVSDWWNRASTGHTEGLGDSFKVDFGSAWVDFKITEATPDKRMVWHVEDCHLPWLKDQTEWKGTRVVWDLATISDATEITMTHEGLTPEVECFKACEAGWNFHIGTSLLKLLTEDQGLPDWKRN